MTNRVDWHALWIEVARQIAQRSLCVRAQVGAVIVDPTNRIVSTGYNGPPSGFQHDDQPCDQWCERATAPTGWTFEVDDMPADRPLPTIEVQPDGRHYAIYPGGQPELIEDLDAFFLQHGGKPVPNVREDYSDCPALHAEANALIAADRSTWQGGTIYVLGDVCSACAKLIANAGLAHLVVVSDGEDRSYRHSQASYAFLARCGVEVNRL